MTAPLPILNWIKRIPSTLLQQSGMPLMGYPPSFPWEELASQLATLLELEELAIKPKIPFETRSESDITMGLGDHIIPLHLSVAPQGGYASWLMSKEDIALLMSILLTHQMQPLEFIDADFEQGFYNFLAIEVINTISQLEFDQELSIHILKEGELPKSACLCIDISISIKNKTMWGRLVISPELQQQLKEKYAAHTLDIPLSQHIDLDVHMEAGKISLPFAEWSQVSLGDVVLLDSCSLKNGEGDVLLSIHNMPVFRAKLQGGNIKIIEQAQYHEGNSVMNQEDEHEEIEEEELEDEDFTFDEEEEEEEEDVEEEFGEEEARENWPPPPEKRPVPAPKEEKAKKPQVAEKPKQTNFSPDNIPLNITVEVGRLQMSLQKIMELQPGNILELGIHPENGVDLVINGKRIAKGELLLIGEMLGVRILDIGS